MGKEDLTYSFGMLSLYEVLLHHAEILLFLELQNNYYSANCERNNIQGGVVLPSSGAERRRM